MDWLNSMSEFEFLFWFYFLNMLCLFVAWVVIRSGSDRYIPPDIHSVDPIAFAALHGSDEAALDTAVVQLMARRIIKIEETLEGKRMSIQTTTAELSPVEKVVYDYVLVPRSQSEFIEAIRGCRNVRIKGFIEYIRNVLLQFTGVRKGDESLQGAVEKALEPVYRQWQEQGLLIPDLKRGNVVWGSVLFWDGLAITKVLLEAFVRHHVSTGLLWAMLVCTIACLSLFLCRLTSSGNHYIEEVNEQFSRLSGELDSTRYVLEAAIKGVAIWTVDSAYKALHPKRSRILGGTVNPLISQYQAFAEVRSRYDGGD